MVLNTDPDPADESIVDTDERTGGQIAGGLELDANPEWSQLLAYLLEARGFDFHGYKPASLVRRIRKRMDAVGEVSFRAYRQYLESHPAEFEILFNTILINVTRFFRDPTAWEVVRTVAIPHIMARKGPDEPIRAWSAGCATGEEAYTIAMLLAEVMGSEEFARRVKIYATDLDEEALNIARQAAYSDRQVEGVPPALLGTYFEQVDGLFFFRKEFRRQLIFGRHDLINDAPISKIDLLSCRNTLMYLSAETQARVLSRLHFALNEDGYLLLGRAETLITHGRTFEPVDLKRRLSRRPSSRSRRESLMRWEEKSPVDFSSEVENRMHAAALELSPVAQIVVDSAEVVMAVNQRARSLFELRTTDVGRPLRDLQLSCSAVELHSLVERSALERRPVVKEIEWHSHNGESRWLELSVGPILDGADVIGSVIAFDDLTPYRKLQREVEQSCQGLETVHEELQATNAELETTNEQLQSTVEELETTSEELQSTNEELETMNEELQSINQELQTLNDELRQRGDELNSANLFLESILTSLRGGVAVVDRQLRVLAWNEQAEKLWGLREEEVRGKHLLNLEIGLPLERLSPVLGSCISGEGDNQRLLLEGINRRGASIHCELTCAPLLGPAHEIQGAILIMDQAADGSS